MRKKSLLTASIAILLLVSNIITMRFIRERNSDLYFETMLEALVESEYAGEPCYNAIQNGVSMWVIYCGECDRLTKGEPIYWAGMDTCK